MSKLRGLTVLGLAVGLSIAGSTLVYAGQWEKEGERWRYKFSDGTYAIGNSYFIDGNHDDCWELYGFDKEGYLITDHEEHVESYNDWLGHLSSDVYHDSDGKIFRNGELATADLSIKANEFLAAQVENADYTYIGEDKFKPEIMCYLCKPEDLVRNNYQGTIQTVKDRGQNLGSLTASSITYTNGVEFNSLCGYVISISATDPSLLFNGFPSGTPVEKAFEIFGEDQGNNNSILGYPPTKYIWYFHNDALPMGSNSVSIIYEISSGKYTIGAR